MPDYKVAVMAHVLIYFRSMSHYGADELKELAHRYVSSLLDSDGAVEVDWIEIEEVFRLPEDRKERMK